MREHLATLLDDFRSYGREIAVVRYQGNRRRVTTYGEVAQPGRPFCRAAGRAGHRAWRPRSDLGPRTAPNGSPPFMAACCAVSWRFLWTPAGQRDFAERVAADVAPKLAVGDALLLSQLPVELPQLAFEDWLAALARRRSWPHSRAIPRDAATNPIHLRHHGRSQGHCAHPRQRAGQPGPHRGRRADPICAMSG